MNNCLFFKRLLCLALAVSWGHAPGVLGANHPSRGLWVGEVTLNKVNETVVGINAANQVAAPDPAVPTPVASPAHLRIIFHVDGDGKVRLLKSVAVLANGTNQPPDLALVTDESLYPNFISPGNKIATASYDFGDGNASEVLNRIAASAASAASVGGNATNAASQTVQSADLDARYNPFARGAGLRSAALNSAGAAAAGAIARKNAGGTPEQVVGDALSAATNHFIVVTNRAYAQSLQSSSLFLDSRYVAAVDSISSAAAGAAASSANSNLTALVIGSSATNAALAALTNAINAPSAVSISYQTFIASSVFLSSANVAAAAAHGSLTGPAASLTQTQKQNVAEAAALKALTLVGAFRTADAAVINEVPMNGSVAAGTALTGTVFLGANHPTNPFRHRMHPDHGVGYPITRALKIQFDSASGTNAFQTAGFGVDRLSGTYREEISGLHKPLGPNQDIGLITQGFIKIDRISLVDTLNR